jgi:signal transduction histidine kinase
MAISPKRVGLLFLLWTAVGIFFSTQLYFLYNFRLKRTVPYSMALRSTLVDWYVWGALSLVVARVARRFPWDRALLFRSVVAHVICGLAFSFVHIVLACVFSALVGMFAWRELGEAIVHNVIWGFHWNLFVYLSIVGIVLATDYRKRAEERTVRASRLEARLAQAQLEALRAQIQPHFLFNTLNAISTLVHKNPAQADRMLVRLGDLLRFLLGSAGEQEISLRREIEFLRTYLDIEQTRFSDRLQVEFAVEESILEAQVPNLILQPLVENSIRHGIAQCPEGGTLEIRAARGGDGALELEVLDSGPGLPPDGTLVEGIGLRNTRARLHHLYGEAQSLALINLPTGGVRARIRLPYRAGKRDLTQTARGAA